MGRELIEAVLSAILDTVILAYLYKDYKKRKFYYYKFVLAVLLFIIMIMSKEIFCIDAAGVQIALSSFVYLVSGYILYDISRPIKYIQQTVIMFVGGNVADTLTVLPILILQNNNSMILGESFIEWLVLLIISRSIYFVIIYIIVKFGFIKSVKNDIKEQLAVFVVFVGLYLYILYLTKIMFIEKHQMEDFWILLFFTTFLVLILALSFFVLGKQRAERISVKKEMEMLKEKNKYEMEVYQEKRQAEIELRKMHHDIRNMQLLVRAYKEKGVNTEEIDSYIKKMEDYFSVKNPISTGNEILDIFLRETEKECEQKKIQLICQVNFAKGDFIHIVDMGTIFGNILNNAKEACEKIQEFEKRKIVLQTGTYEKFIIIKCVNPFVEIKEVKGRFLTTKKDKVNHGLGLISLEEVLEDYEGEISYKAENGNFFVTILIPIQSRSAK